MVYEEPKKMLLYGDACRVSTDPIAKASYFFDLIQISYADTDPIYTIENYPNFFRVVPSENALSLARIPFIRHFNWTRVGTIYQNLPRYSLPHSKLLTDLERYNIVIKQSVSLPGSVDGFQNRDLGDELRKLKDKDVRIILGNFDEEWALLLFCEAYREKMIGRKYQWLLTGFSEAKLWLFYESKGSQCSKQELLIAMDGYIITDITPVTRSQQRTISGLMAHEYLNEYQRRAREMNITIEENKFYGYVYDGIWAIALALNRVDTLLKHYSRLARQGKVKLRPEFEHISSLLDFQYHQPIWVKLLRDALNATRFDGVTGTVSFKKNERPGVITFSQFQAFRDMTEVIIGSYDALDDRLDLNVGFPIIWRGSSPPIDYTIQRVKPFRINRTLFVIISILALLGIVLACVFLFVNIKFRNQRYIKMSSPYLNNLIIIGCILTFTSVIILGLDSGLTSELNFPYICNARAWVLMAGFTLAFGSMFSKTFRVHSIFTNIKLHKKVIKDYKLFMVVFILLTFDVCILVVWQYFDPFYRETNNGTSTQDPDNEDVIIVPEMEHCQSKRMTIFLSVIYVYKGLLMAFGCFLAWETRHVSIPALNDSKYIGLSVYNVVIMCVIGASLSFILRDQQDASFVIISIFIIFCSTTTLCLVFVPKLIELKQNPRASDHRVRATLKTFKKNYYHDEALATGCRDIHGNIIGRGYGMDLNERIKILVDENFKQRSLLKEKTYELEALTSKYRKIQSMVQSGQFLQAINTSAAANSPAAKSSPLTPQPGCSGGLKQPAARGGPLVSGCSMVFSSATATTLISSPPSCTINKSTSQPSSDTAATTTILMTGRSPTRDRVSFSSTLNAHEPGQASSSSRPPPPPPPQQQQRSSPAHQPRIHESDSTALRRSPMMSSTTQITQTTTTTSSANNNTDLTADFSSPKMLMSGATTLSSSSAGCSGGHHPEHPGRRHHHWARRFDQLDPELEDGASLGPRVEAISRQVAAVRQQHPQRRPRDQTIGQAGEPKQRLVFRSQEDLSLFTILSYDANSRASNSMRGRDLEEANSQTGASNKLGQWLEGPFCTVLLRQTSLEGSKQRVGSCNAPSPSLRQLNNDLSRSARFRKQYSQQADHSRDRLTLVPTKNMLMSHVRERLPRTLSMIEYLGLNDFELIARRHDKILRYRRGMDMQADSRQLSCCASCSCCLAQQRQHVRSAHRHHSTPTRDFRQRHQHHSSSQTLGRHNYSAANCNRQIQLSEGDLATPALSFSCPLDDRSADDLLHSSTSLVSCSTCCSLVSQTYGSHSELYQLVGSLDRHQHRHSRGNNNEFTFCDSSSSGETSRTISSSMSESSSIVVGGSNRNTGSLRAPSDSQSGGASATSMSASSQSSSIMTLNQAADCPIHHDHYRTHQPSHRLQALIIQPHQGLPSTHAHHLSSEAISSRSEASSNTTQVASAAQRPLDVEQQAQESLYTSGVFYGAPSAKEDANDAARLVACESGPVATACSGPVGGVASTPAERTKAQPPIQKLEQPNAIISIKCDILEDL